MNRLQKCQVWEMHSLRRIIITALELLWCWSFFSVNRRSTSHSICFWQAGGISSVLESISAGRVQLHPQYSDISNHVDTILCSYPIFESTCTEQSDVLNIQLWALEEIPRFPSSSSLGASTPSVTDHQPITTITKQSGFHKWLKPAYVGKDTLFLF